MMPDAVCNLHTGLQGHGKTLNTLKHVEELRKSSGRAVFYSGIRDLKLEWEQFGGPGPDPAKPWFTDASEWFKLPQGAIIVIDEAQRLFRPRGNGTAVPLFEQALETLRHNGHTLFLITQMPKLVSTHVRSLCGVHRHYMRKFGSRWATVHEWASVRESCDKSRKDSMESQIVFPSDYYDKYTSAEVHTVKFKVPWKIWVALTIPFFLGWAFYWTFYGRMKRDVPAVPPPAAAAVQAGPQGQGMPGMGGAGRGGYEAPQTAQELYQSLTPRVVGLPYTAPRYDALTAPVRVPVIVGCWMQGDNGWCITQQGSRITLPRLVMASFIERGAFVDFEPGPDLGAGHPDRMNGQVQRPGQAQ